MQMIRDIRKERIPLLAIFLLACAVRFYGIGFGLPHTECRPDESSLVFKALSFFSGDFNPHFFNYPTLYMYVLWVIYGVYLLCRFIVGLSTSDMLLEVAIAPGDFFLISRILSALMGSATVVVVYLLARRLTDRKTALLAGFFTSVSYLHVRDSHFGVTDVSMTCLAMGAMAFIMACDDTPNARNYSLAGVCTGLAASTKYAGGLLVLPMIYVHLARHIQDRTSISNEGGRRFALWAVARAAVCALKHRLIWRYGLFAGVFFLAFTPFALLDFATFVADFRYEIQHLAFGHAETVIERGWWYHARYTLPYGMGWPLFLSALAGMGIYARKDATRALGLFLFPLALYTLAGRGYTVFVRYMVPVVPFLCISAAIFAVYVSDALTRHANWKGVIPVVAAVIAAQSLYRSVRFDHIMASTDNRVIAADWIVRNLPTGSTIYQAGGIWGQVQLPWALESLQKAYGEMRRQGRRGRLLKVKMAHLRQTGGEGGYRRWEYEGQNALPEAMLPGYVIIQESPLRAYSRVPQPIAQAVEVHYRLKKMFHAANFSSERNCYDQQDAFYVPYAGFTGIERPGPNIHIYERSNSR